MQQPSQVTHEFKLFCLYLNRYENENKSMFTFCILLDFQIFDFFNYPSQQN